MANHNKKKSGGAFVAGVVVALLAALGIGELGIGNFEGGLVSDIFTPAEEIVMENEESGLYEAEITVADNVISIDGKVVTVDELKAQLAQAGGERVLLIDGGATHATWQEVLNALSELDCIVETQ